VVSVNGRLRSGEWSGRWMHLWVKSKMSDNRYREDPDCSKALLRTECNYRNLKTGTRVELSWFPASPTSGLSFPARRAVSKRPKA
jgi:hypothetical protein